MFFCCGVDPFKKKDVWVGLLAGDGNLGCLISHSFSSFWSVGQFSSLDFIVAIGNFFLFVLFIF
jgi:hypothetical protein